MCCKVVETNLSAIAGFGLNSKEEGAVGTEIAGFVLNFKEEGPCGNQ